MAERRDPDAEMDDLELYSGRWCGHNPEAPPDNDNPTGVVGDADGERNITPAATATPPTTTPENRRQVNDRLNNMLAHRGHHPPSTVTSVGNSTRGDSSVLTGGSYAAEQDLSAFGRGYVQCRSARQDSRSTTGIEASTGPEFGKLITLEPEKIGNLNMSSDKMLYKTFRGCRVTSKGKTVNQTISTTFDPQTLLCTVCETEHSIIPSDGTDLAILVGDQNFVSALSGKSSCLPIIRLEDPTLMELFEICLEIFDRYTIPSGTLFLVNSTSFLCEMGSTIFSLEWLNMCRAFNNRWQHVKVGPLPPVLREASPPVTTKVIVEIWRWFNCMYGTDICYPKSAWDIAIKQLSENNEQLLDLAARDTYRVALPVSLSSSTLTHHKFTVSSSLPTTLAFSGEATVELLHALITQLNIKFGVNAHPEDVLAREPAELEGAMETNTTGTGLVIVCGGSICKKLASDLKAMQVNLVDLTIPGWKPTPANIEKLQQDIALLKPNTILLCDLVSNVCFCFEQINGTLALPVKSGGRYHMHGGVTTSSQDALQNILGKLTPLLQSVPCLKICLPPLPRYLFSACCMNEDHCEGVGTVGYAEDLLCKTLNLRKTLRDYLYSKVGGIWVPDTLTELANSTLSQTETLKGLFSLDGVHLNAAGSSRYADIVKGIIDEKFSAASCVSGREPQREFFWRGFVSPVGSSRPKNSASYHAPRPSGGGKWKSSRGGTGSSGGSGRYLPPTFPGRRR